MEKHLLLKRTIEEKCIIRHSEQRIISSSDKSQSWLIDLKSILMSPAPLGAIASLFWDRFEDRLPFQVGGMEFSAVPIITAIVLEGQNRGYNVNGFIIRKKRKETGLGKSIEGTINSYPIVLIDDIVNSGKSLIKASAVLNGNTVQISSAFCVIDYESDGARTWSSEVGIPIERLFVLSEFGLSLMQSDPPSASIDYSVLWRTGDTSGNPFHVTPKSAPIVWNNRVYMGTESGDFLCRQTENGEELWCYRTKTSNQKGIWSTASIHEGRVFFGGYDGTLYCLDALTGKDIWKTIACEYIGSSPCIAGLLGLVLIGLENDIHGRRGANAAFDTITGNLVWADPLQELQHGSAVFCPQTGRAIFGTCDGFLVSYNAKTGDRMWTRECNGPIKSAPALSPDGKIVAAGSFDGSVYLVDAQSGLEIERVETDGPIYTTPLFYNGRLYFGSSDRYFYQVDLSLNYEVRRVDTKSRILAPPSVIDGSIIVGSISGTLFEFDPESLALRASPQLSDAVTNAAAYDAEYKIVLVSTALNDLFALRRGASAM